MAQDKQDRARRIPSPSIAVLATKLLDMTSTGKDDLWQTIEAWLDEGWNREATGSYEDLKLQPLARVLANFSQQAPLPRPITIAGTKGKGSTARLIESILVAHGRPTVTFSSPHVIHISERWRLDGQPVPAPIMAGALQRAKAAVPRDVHLTYFERCFVLAVALTPGRTFICEVGLGGRLDCANALPTGLAVLTHLSLDHVHILGDTVEKIALEKIAIARPDADIYVGPQSHITTAALQGLAPRHLDFVTPPPFSGPMQLAGAHQGGNAGLALAVAKRVLGHTYRSAVAEKAIKTATLLGRSQVISKAGRQLFLDGAHNDASLRAVLATTDQHFATDIPIILGLAQDKDAEAIADILPMARVHRVGYAGERSRGADDWPSAYDDTPWHASIAEALATMQGPAIVCGSFYLVGECLSLVEGETN